MRTAKELSQICDDVFANIPIGFAEVRKTLQSKVQGFQKGLEADSDKVLADFVEWSFCWKDSWHSQNRHAMD